MTDNEIIKAFGLCNYCIEGGCGDCPCRNHEGVCLIAKNEFDLEREAFNLFNRQKAEVERLERYTEMYHEVRAEAIKETIKAVKSKSSSSVMISNGIVIAGTRSYQISEVTLDQIEKEMVDESNG